MRYSARMEDGRIEYYLDVVSAAKLLGVARRTLDTYLKKIEYDKINDKRRIGMKVFISETLLSRLWVYSRRCENYSAYPNNRGAKSAQRKKELGMECESTVVMRDGGWISIGNKYLTEKEKKENGL